MKPRFKELEAVIDQALGNTKGTLVIKNISIFHLATGELRKGDIAVCGDRIAGVGESYDGETEIDGSGLFAVPGFIDAHAHSDLSLLAAPEAEGKISQGITRRLRFSSPVSWARRRISAPKAPRANMASSRPAHPQVPKRPKNCQVSRPET